ncbi:hypothetical protein [Streptomyces sp. MST-110588]|uniref:hypothetical protein n=1 Tax=Streptomyces sp. MST-110588 TaxID=2833628 RepID=UPI001F5D3B58|nr:hypothetical protein [Streptomyces sp. MST-110588]UNO41461.1 hypothetical protein KGS77_20170 [Streptomyces sp. MST-110588]
MDTPGEQTYARGGGPAVFLDGPGRHPALAAAPERDGGDCVRCVLWCVVVLGDT